MDKEVNLFIQKLFKDRNVYPRSISTIRHKDGLIEVLWTEYEDEQKPFVRKVRPFTSEESND